MNFFKKPVVAVILALILCSSILVLNTQIKLGDEIDAVEDAFFENVEGQRSIYTRLQEKLQATNGVWSILARYDEQAAQALADEQDYLQWACDSAVIIPRRRPRWRGFQKKHPYKGFYHLPARYYGLHRHPC